MTTIGLYMIATSNAGLWFMPRFGVCAISILAMQTAAFLLGALAGVPAAYWPLA